MLIQEVSLVSISMTHSKLLIFFIFLNLELGEAQLITAKCLYTAFSLSLLKPISIITTVEFHESSCFSAQPSSPSAFSQTQ